MVSELVGKLTLAQRLTIMKGGKYPNKLRWATIYTSLETYLSEDGGQPVQLTPNAKRNIRTAAKNWTTRFLKSGDIHDEPPHKPGYQVERNSACLQKIYDLICEGYKDSKGYLCIYNSLEHLELCKPEAQQLRMAPRPHGCGLKTTRALWNQLQAKFPDLDEVAVNAKRERNAAPVQVRVLLADLRCSAKLPAVVTLGARKCRRAPRCSLGSSPSRSQPSTTPPTRRASTLSPASRSPAVRPFTGTLTSSRISGSLTPSRWTRMSSSTTAPVFGRAALSARRSSATS